MAAMALALGVGLQKPEVYALNGAGRAPQEADMARALNLASKTVAALASLALVAMVCIVFMSTL